MHSLMSCELILRVSCCILGNLVDLMLRVIEAGREYAPPVPMNKGRREGISPTSR